MLVRWCASILLLLASCVHASAVAVSRLQYVIIIDAGSSGSRLSLYKFPTNGADGGASCSIGSGSSSVSPSLVEYDPKVRLPLPLTDVSTVDVNVRSEDGVHTPAGRAWIGEALKSVKTGALASIGDVSSVPVFVYATAGLRILPRDVREGALADIRAAIRASGYSLSSDSWVRTISGEQEAVFDWLSVQSQLNGGTLPLDALSYRDVGVLDMGGASTQMVFYSKEGPLAGSQEIALGCSGLRGMLYAHSYLYAGAKEFKLRVLDKTARMAAVILCKDAAAGGGAGSAAVVAACSDPTSAPITLESPASAILAILRSSPSTSADGTAIRIPSPCHLASGDSGSATKSSVIIEKVPLLGGVEVGFLGTGDYESCAALVRTTMKIGASCSTDGFVSGIPRGQSTCTFDGVYMPPGALPPKFKAIGAFPYLYKHVGAQPTASLADLRERVRDACKGGIAGLRSRLPKESLGRLQDVCILGTYFTVLMIEGYRLPVKEEGVVTALDKTGWTDGAAAYITNNLQLSLHAPCGGTSVLGEVKGAPAPTATTTNGVTDKVSSDDTANAATADDGAAPAAASAQDADDSGGGGKTQDERLADAGLIASLQGENADDVGAPGAREEEAYDTDLFAQRKRRRRRRRKHGGHLQERAF